MPDKSSQTDASRIPLRSLETLDAGEFRQWLDGSVASQQHGEDADVPCGECNSCCKSFYFIHITPNDQAALGAIPQELLFDAPGLPPGHFVMGYNEHGECPMLHNDRCSIYAARPQTCRAYDCRVFTATGIAPGETDKELVARQTVRWRFSHADATSRSLHNQVQRAATWLVDGNNPHVPDDFVPGNSTQQAVLALQLHSLFTEDQPAHARLTREFADEALSLARRKRGN